MPARKAVMLAGQKVGFPLPQLHPRDAGQPWRLHSSTPIMYNAARRHFAIQRVIVEDAVPMREFLLRRVRKLGTFTVFGQVLFKLLVEPGLSFAARARIREIKREFSLDETKIDPAMVTRVRSVNSQRVEALLREIDPDVVIISGTRIISKQLLSSIRAPFINMHAGITPLYRGGNGGYWALVEGRREACGVTVHLVDPGIDTGRILGQTLIEPTGRDNFITYPFLQLAAGIPLLISAVNDVCDGHMNGAVRPAGPSKLWSHPTAFGYLYHRVVDGVK